MDNLTELVKIYEGIGYPAIIERFVLRNGTTFVDAVRPKKMGQIKQCFKNASHMALGDDSLTYHEGFMKRPDLPIFIHHAWVVDRQGTAIDPTLRDVKDVTYTGVPIDTDSLMKQLMMNRVYGVLDTGTLNIDYMFGRDPGLAEIVKKIVGHSIVVRRA